jgi:dodecin
MSEHTYAITHVVGSSPESIDQAIRNGIGTVAESVRHLEWFEVDQIRGYLGDGADVAYFQVMMKVGFRYEGQG